MQQVVIAIPWNIAYYKILQYATLQGIAIKLLLSYKIKEQKCTWMFSTHWWNEKKITTEHFLQV